MRTQKYIDQSKQQNEQFQEAILDIQRQLAELQQQLRVNQQLEKARESGNRELTGWLKQGEKLMRDLAGVFPQDFLTDIIEEVTDISSTIESQYDEYAQAGRFLDAEVQEQQDGEPQLALDSSDEPLPSDDDNETILSSNQVMQVLSTLDKTLVLAVRDAIGISRKLTRLDSIVNELIKLDLTMKDLGDVINMVSNQKSMLARFNR